MAQYPLGPSVSLAAQLVILGLIALSMAFKGQKRFRAHGASMSLAVIIHSITIIAIMLPSFSAGIVPYISENPGNAIGLISLFHGVTGLLAWVLGIWLVASWHLSPSNEKCFKRGGAMRITLVVWMVSLILGILMYLNFYTAFLPL
ncbi:hypothetical protein H5T51_09595 [Candidatus Bathyarchaeota archaeon]|nr:hypothetical protein [Candidatus Bathyarchaeota archaeon]